MEGGSASEGYQIASARIPILLTLKRIRDLKPHEQTFNEDLQRLTATLAKDPVLRHPIITDSETGLVLDGTHRLAALAQLDYELVPCAMIDYQNPSIIIERWFREISGASLHQFRENAKQFKLLKVTPAEAEDQLKNRSSYASIQDAESCFILPTSDKDASTLVRQSFQVEEVARKSGLKVAYGDDNAVPKDANQFLLSTIRLNKQETIAASESGRIFPPKTTRHIIPSRPLGTRVPLKWLRSPDLEGAREKFMSHLRKMRVRHLPGGTWIGSRRYEEEVFLFE